MSREQFEARVGSWLRRKWKLERLIGVGGMAGVYVARHKIGRIAAIKLLRAEIADRPEVRERFEQEAAAVNGIGHEGVVEILDVDEDDDGTPFLVMELLEGETLADRVEREGPPPIAALLEYVDQTLDVLVACHRKGVIHRDIKPENLFIQRSGPVKVLDFGIARVREGVQTSIGTMLGTVAFMPPEQLRGLGVDGRADLYALGATMFTILAGRRVHRAKDDVDLAAKVLADPAPPLLSVAPEVPENVAWVVDRALAYLPERRYPDAQTMRGDVWALERGGRPPYAHACREAGLSADATEADDTAQRSTRPDGTGGLPSTDPQLPAFAGLPSTDPQLPIFVHAPASEPHAAASNEPPIPEPPTSQPPASQPPTSKPPTSQPPASQPPASQPPRMAPLRPGSTIFGFPRAPGERGKPPNGEAEAVAPDEALEEAQREKKLPSSIPPARAAGEDDPESALPERRRRWWWVAALVIAAGAVGGAWAAGLRPF